LVVESTDRGLTEGKVGLAKFRDTKAEFKNFQVGKKVESAAAPAEVAARVARKVENIAPTGTPKPEMVEALEPDGPAGLAALRERARLLDQQAAHLRRLALAVHHKQVQAELAKEDDIDLAHAALLIARLDNDEVDVEAYRKEVDRMAKDIAAGL